MNPPMVGDAIPPLRRRVTRDVIRAYADASSDRNPLHLDDAFAAGTAFGGVIAHGMLSVAYVSQAMHRWLGSAWESGSGMSVAFLKPVRPNDEVTVTGVVRSLDPKDDHVLVVCDVEVRNQREEVVIGGEAWACVPGG